MEKGSSGLLLALVIACTGCSGGGDEVVVNGRELSAGQLEEIQRTYGQRPKPGEYWYDRASGLYGADGCPAAGFMLPGHVFGDVLSDASDGDSGVFVNGRELPYAEVEVWSALLGTPIAPGRFWMDGYGNVGREGVAVPAVNLFVAARQTGYGVNGGDRFWSSRFSAGNSDPGNTRGYVSVPGYGPVGYGFD